MKPVYTRRYRRRSTAAPEGNFFKKESNEQSFFAEPAVTPFFSAAPVASNAAVQRKCDKCEQEDKKLQRTADDKKEEGKLQRKEAGTGSVSAAAGFAGKVSSGGTPLSPALNSFFGGRMGADFSQVQIHTGTEAAAAAKSVNAKAYTVGNHIVFNQGQYQPGTYEGKKLIAHELTHVVQQQQGVVARKEVDEAGCDDAQLNLEGNTDAVYNKGAGTMIGEKKKAAKDCEDCVDDCVSITGTLAVPYDVQTTVTLPDVPDDLRPCQQKRVANVIKTKLAPHEQKHVAAFKTFNGKGLLPVKYKGCEGGYNSYLEDLAQAEFDRRKDIADKKSAALDPYSEDVDVCCKDTDTTTHPAGKK
jgi:hypothetical protein